MAVIASIKRAATKPFLRASLAYSRASLGHKPSPRVFDRVCVVAAVSKNSGIAKGAILQYEALRRLGFDAGLLDVTPAMRNPLLRVPHKPATVYILHSGGPQVGNLLTSVLPHVKNAYRIAYWAWELPTPPREWPNPNGLVSEIWTCSTYAKQSLEKHFTVPIHAVHHAVQLQPFNKPEDSNGFQVLVVADSRSSLERKNLKGSIAAFFQAFSATPAARLVIKFSGHPADIDHLLPSSHNRQKVTVINAFLSEAEMRQLFQSSDVLLSLHRAEGFGLPMLEAMAVGTPVVASRWSGNLEFMNDDNSLLIDCRPIQVADKTIYSRYTHSTWADPDIHQAAIALNRLFKDAALRHTLAANGLETAQNLLTNWRVPGTPNRSLAQAQEAPAISTALNGQ